MSVPVIAFTGGPCGGKTTIMANQVENLLHYGFRPIICPESATTLFGCGFRPTDKKFQAAIFKNQVRMENLLKQAASGISKPVILCDRGLLDGLAFVDRSIMADLAKPSTLEYLRDSRYKGIVHLQTAAIDAEKFYTLENNKARSETPEQARQLDERLLDAYNGHPKHIVIANRAITFDQKKNMALETVLNILGAPYPIEDEKRYLIDGAFNPSDIPSYTVASPIVQDYLLSDEGIERVRKRGLPGSEIYFHTIKIKVDNSTTDIEKEKIISKREYEKLLTRRDPQSKTIRKTRYTFHWNNLYFELDRFNNPVNYLILEVEKTNLNTVIEIPGFLLKFIVKEVTGVKEYTNAWIAHASSITK